MRTPVEEAIQILEQNDFSVRSSLQATLAAGSITKQEQYLSSALSSRFRVFVINQSFVKHDLPECKGILFNGKVSTPQNTLFVGREAHRKKIPETLAHITVKALSNKAKGSEIAENIMEFIEENKTVTPIPTDEFDSGPKKGDNLKEDKHMMDIKRLFLDATDRFNHKRLYPLCVCVKPAPNNANVLYDALSLIPWPKVFDFDVDTNSSGLYSIVKDKLPKGRLHFLTKQDKETEIRQNIVSWTAMTVSENDDGEFDRHISSLAKFCSGRKPATMIILWYVDNECDELTEDLRDFITKVRFSFRDRKIKFVLCLPKVPDNRTDMSTICKRNPCHGSIAPLETVCQWILSLRDELATNVQAGTTRLPKLKECDEDENTFELEQEAFEWITVDLRVLTVSSPSSSTKVLEDDKVHKHGIEFLKGGEMTWDVLENERFDVCRDKFSEIRAHINHLVQNGQSSIVTLYHAPGSGGSTLGRQVLWSFRNEVPCLALETRSEIPDDFKEKMRLIRDQSNLPVLLLINGRSGQEARNILDMCRYERIVILHVIRHYFSVVKNHLNKSSFFLCDKVSAKEAPEFKSILIKYGTAGIKKTMQKLTQDIEQGSSHSVFEYGLSAFNLDFRGIGKYVASHLRLRNKTEKWHRVAAMLSLANYYGNRAIPVEFFWNTLEKEDFESVNLADDIPELGQQLIRECSEGTEWKISHYLVAKEIMEQYLGGDASDSNTAQLSAAACRKLLSLAVEFLRCMKVHGGEECNLNDDLLSILKDIFIKRSDRDEEDDDEPKRKQNLFSRLIADIGDKAQQQEIFTMLVEISPSNAEFHAHFGRFLAKISCHREAEKALKKAINIRLDILKDKGVDALVRGDDVLQRIHSMFGFAYHDHLRHVFGNKAVGSMVRNAYATISISAIKDAFKIATAAIDEFRQSSRYYCPSVNQSYAYTGEIKVRLRITEFCKKQTNHNLISISSSQHPLHFLWGFVAESLAECEHLLSQCIAKYGVAGTGQREIQQLLDTFMKYYYNGSPRLLEKFVMKMKRGSFSSNRCQITIMKLSFGNLPKREFHVFSDLPKEQFRQYASLLEAVIDDRNSSGIRISPYMEDWIKVSRHLEPSVSLTRAKSYVDDWDRRNEKESFSSFYRYVIQFAITLFDLTPANRTHLTECKERLEQCQRYLKQNIVEIPIERFRQHVSSQNKDSLSLFKNFWNDQKDPLQEFYGQVIDAKVWSGRIEIQGTGLKVFFVPKKFNVRSYDAKSKQRVKFFIGFNAKRGAQAYDVTLLSTFTCKKCSFQIEHARSEFVLCPICYPSPPSSS